MSDNQLQISAAFAPALQTPEHIALAEQLGFARAWCYDGPAIWADLWMTLARAADRTKRIGLGTAVLVPSYRHVMTTAAAIATLAGQAPGRVVVGLGVGHGNKMMGGGAMPWKETARYLSTLRALLKGDEVECGGSLAKMLHSEGFVARRPIDVPILVAAQGPKGLEIARTLADGVITAMMPNPGFKWSSVLLMGTVLPEDGSVEPRRLMDAAGPAAAAAYHTTYGADWRNGPAFAHIPNAESWVAELEKTAPERRHLAAWSKHLVGLTQEDKLALTPEAVRQMTFTGTPDELRTRLRDIESKGATEVIYQPAGSDIPGELRRFAAMAGL
ncbi:MAG: LLM class flavin-dependent oxidoreductase [Steroidobacteraceae bacterium]